MVHTTSTINASLEKVWECYTSPEHITKWAFASDDWEAPHAENDLRVGGKFSTKMAAKDKSEQFDFSGVYSQVKEHELIAYTMDDGRKVIVKLSSQGDATKVDVDFDPEQENSEELQRTGWQAILDNFKKHTESC
ncbi:MAG: SRPBCC domain-containing protein [Candidatus Levybacteria bacterium]|nr:SRPBCC domain-containing protein [Candidatus Levybacteria bacterium]